MDRFSLMPSFYPQDSLLEMLSRVSSDRQAAPADDPFCAGRGELAGCPLIFEACKMPFPRAAGDGCHFSGQIGA
jgi:hypothetical protein